MAQKTVLLAEDDLEIRDILQDLLEAEGYDVVPASHGRQALEFLQGARGEKLPDLVVLDLMMPLVDGHQVLDTMKSDPQLASIPVVVLSAVARERPVGAAAFLRKPIPLQKFFDTIKGFVEAGLSRPGLAGLSLASVLFLAIASFFLGRLLVVCRALRFAPRGALARLLPFLGPLSAGFLGLLARLSLLAWFRSFTGLGLLAAVSSLRFA